jgi:WhiB family redox-sensing transcriptional regulator
MSHEIGSFPATDRVHYAPARWSGTASCASADPEFFPVDEDRPSAVAAAKALCARCEVRQRCLAYALATGMSAGVWGGLSTAERTVVVRSRHQDKRTSGGTR